MFILVLFVYFVLNFVFHIHNYLIIVEREEGGKENINCSVGECNMEK